MLKIVAILFSVILFSTSFALSQVSPEETNLWLFRWTDTRVNAGYDIVFWGNLKTNSNEPIKKAEIIIKIDAPCPEDGIIARGFTDYQGRYFIKTEALIWDEVDNLIKAHAEFLDTDEYLSSISREQIVVIYPAHGKKCEL